LKTEKEAEKDPALARDTTPMPSYYKNWDKIDVDEEMKKIDNDETIGFDKTLGKKGDSIKKEHEPTVSPEELK